MQSDAVGDAFEVTVAPPPGRSRRPASVVVDRARDAQRDELLVAGAVDAELLAQKLAAVLAEAGGMAGRRNRGVADAPEADRHAVRAGLGVCDGLQVLARQKLRVRVCEDLAGGARADSVNAWSAEIELGLFGMARWPRGGYFVRNELCVA